VLFEAIRFTLLADAVDMAAVVKAEHPELAKNAAEARVVPFSEESVECVRELFS
jgi:hypothetical protein